MKHLKIKYKKNEYVNYTFLFLICISVILSPFVIYHKSLIQDGDSFNQSFPLFVYIGQWLRACIHGEIRLFDFRLGLGDDVLHALNWHGFGDITQILSVIVPYNYAEFAYSFVMILKLWLCGISFLIYIKRYVQHRRYRMIGALLYACNTYALAWGFNCWMLLAPMMTFPLILSGIDIVCEHEDYFSNELLIGLLVQTMNGFYFLYMETFLAILYFLVKESVTLQSCDLDKIKKFIYDGIKIFLEALLAVCLGAPLLFPSIAGYLQSSRTGGGQSFRIWEMIVHPFDYYRSMLSHLLIPNIYRNILTLGFLPIIGILAVFCHKQNRNKVPRNLLIIFAILSCIPFWGSLMNGLSYHSDRWMFAVALTVSVAAAIGLDMNTVSTRKEKNIYYLSLCILVVLYLTDSDFYPGKILTSMAYVGIGIWLSVAWEKRSKQPGQMFLLAMFLVMINGLLVFGSRKIGGSGYVFGFKGVGETKFEVDQYVDKIKDEKNGFERRDMSAASLGSSLIKNFYGTTEYLSTLNGNTSEFYRSLHISPGAYGATWVLKGLDGRTELDALLSVRHVMEYAGSNLDPVYRYNTVYLPMGVMYQSWIDREQFEQLNPMEKEAALIKYVVMEEGKEKITTLKEDKLDESVLLANKEKAHFTVLQNIVLEGENIYAKENAAIKIYLDDFEDCERVFPVKAELYVQLKDMFLHNQGTADIDVGNKKIQLRSVDDDYYMGVDEFWINVTEWKSDQTGQYFEIRLPEGKEYSLGEIKVYEHEINYAAIEERKENVLGNLEIGVNTISGEADCQEDMLALFTIPYGRGWKAYVDGVEQPVYKADVGFLAIELSEGRHTVLLKYITPGLISGCICAAAGIIILAIIYIRRHGRKAAVH